MKRVEDVLIVGGGPAGAYCAFNLTRKGIKATLLDHSHPRVHKCVCVYLWPILLSIYPMIMKN